MTCNKKIQNCNGTKIELYTIKGGVQIFKKKKKKGGVQRVPPNQ